MIKILDDRPLNGHIRVFHGALSDFEYTIRVVDTVTQEAEYTNAPGNICGRGGTTAF